MEYRSNVIAERLAMTSIGALAALICLQSKGDPIIGKCEEVLNAKNGDALYRKFTDAVDRYTVKKEETEVATIFYSCLLLHASNRKQITNVVLGRYGARVDRIADKQFENPKLRLLQGWWLITCAPSLRMRTDPPARLEKRPVTVNGKVQWIEGSVFETEDPAIARGKALISDSLSHDPRSAVAWHYRLHAGNGLPVTGAGSIRTAYNSLEEPFKWIFLKELVFRDAASKDAIDLQTKWKKELLSKERPFIVQYLNAPEPPKK